MTVVNKAFSRKIEIRPCLIVLTLNPRGKALKALFAAQNIKDCIDRIYFIDINRDAQLIHWRELRNTRKSVKTDMRLLCALLLSMKEENSASLGNDIFECSSFRCLKTGISKIMTYEDGKLKYGKKIRSCSIAS